MPPEAHHPPAWLLGIDHLWRIRTDQIGFYDDLKRRYGDAVCLRLGPYRSWQLFHPRQIELALTQHASSFVRFEKMTAVLRQWNGDSMLLAEGETWHKRRRKVLPAFQTARLPGYGAAAVTLATSFCVTLEDLAGPDGTIEIDTDAAMARLTLDIATKTLFGADPLENGDEVEEAIQVLSAVAFAESTSPLTLPDWLPLPLKRRKKWAMAVMASMVGGLVETRLAEAGAGETDHGDLLSMLALQHEGDEHLIRADVMSLLIAGHETSGALLSWIFASLGRAPEWCEKVQGEIDAVVGDRPVTQADFRSLPQLRAVVDETLRLYPPAYALFLRRAIVPVELDGIRIAEGDLVQITPIAVQRDPRWFEAPEEFRPERFLGEPTWPRYAYIPFGAGPRVCIGQQFGLMEACLASATILRRWMPLAPDKFPEPDPKFSLRPKAGLRQRWRRRDPR
ncbi:MAG: cytochrome P450 [Pseudomonadota bacterium]